MSTTDKKIEEVLGKFGEPMAGNVWRVQGTAVVYHKTLERIAASAKIQFEKPQILRAERDEAVMLVCGHMGDRMEWSIGEACIGTNYRVSGKQAAYPFAMSEKRAKDRVILKLIELHGLVYSEEEADEFKRSAPLSQESLASSQTSVEILETPEESSEDLIVADLKKKLLAAKAASAVTDLMQAPDTLRSLDDLSDAARKGVRDFAAERFRALRPRAVS